MYSSPVSFYLKSFAVSPSTKGGSAVKEKLSALNDRSVVIETLSSVSTARIVEGK